MTTKPKQRKKPPAEYYVEEVYQGDTGTLVKISLTGSYESLHWPKVGQRLLLEEQ